MRRGLSRRELLRAAAGATAAWTLRGCGDDVPPVWGATLEVDEQRAIVAAAAPGAQRVRVTWYDAVGNELGGDEAAVGAGGTAQLGIGPLAPDTGYEYQLVADHGGRTDRFAFTTAPVLARPIRLAFAADVDVDPQWDSPIFDAIAAAAPELFVMIGDFPYCDNAPGAITLDDYRARHQACRGTPKIERWLQTTSLRAIYDDHEVRNNWDATTWADEHDRVVAGLAAWDEWFPGLARAGEDVRAAIRYRRFAWGPLVDAFVLDCRRFKSPHTDPDGPAKTMLGATQKQWLIDGVTASTAPFKLIFTSVPLDYGYVEEHWGVYTYERDAILGAIKDAGTTGTLWLTADQHFFASHRSTFGARELQVGPLARGMPDLPPAVPGVLAQIRTFNFGVLDVAPGDPPTLTFRALDATGTTIYEEAFAPADLALS